MIARKSDDFKTASRRIFSNELPYEPEAERNSFSGRLNFAACCGLFTFDNNRMSGSVNNATLGDSLINEDTTDHKSDT